MPRRAKCECSAKGHRWAGFVGGRGYVGQLLRVVIGDDSGGAGPTYGASPRGRAKNPVLTALAPQASGRAASALRAV